MSAENAVMWAARSQRRTNWSIVTAAFIAGLLLAAPRAAGQNNSLLGARHRSPAAGQPAATSQSAAAQPGSNTAARPAPPNAGYWGYSSAAAL